MSARRARRLEAQLVEEGVREVFRRPGAREVLLAQTIWVFLCVALPAFFVLYAQHSLGLPSAPPARSRSASAS